MCPWLRKDKYNSDIKKYHVEIDEEDESVDEDLERYTQTSTKVASCVCVCLCVHVCEGRFLSNLCLLFIIVWKEYADGLQEIATVYVHQFESRSLLLLCSLHM